MKMMPTVLIMNLSISSSFQGCGSLFFATQR